MQRFQRNPGEPLKTDVRARILILHVHTRKKANSTGRAVSRVKSGMFVNIILAVALEPSLTMPRIRLHLSGLDSRSFRKGSGVRSQ